VASKFPLVVIPVALALSGCPQQSTSQPPPAAAPGCMGAVCNVLISVPTDCDPVPSPDPVPLPTSTPNVVINWRIDPRAAQAGYAFTATNGIVPHDDQDRQFSGHTPASPTHFHVNDKNSNKTKYKYAINVQKGGTACSTKDPFIQNN